jgi:class 3 adenylate cyclase
MNHDPRVIERVLDLLGKWGWETGDRQLREELEAAPDEVTRAAHGLFLGWRSAVRGSYDEAEEQFRALAEVPPLAGWATLGRGYVAMRRRDYPGALGLLARASALADPADDALHGNIGRVRGETMYKEGRPADQALEVLYGALERLGRDRYTTGRVLDVLGMVYAGKDNFHAAREFYDQAVRHAQGFGDEAGLARTYGQLGRLYLDWEDLGRAEEYFRKDLELAQKTRDERGQAQMYNHLGQVALARGERAGAEGRRADADQRRLEAEGWLKAGILACREGSWPVEEGYACKDLARLRQAQGDLADAELQARRAEELFRPAAFAEGLAHVERVLGVVRRDQGRHAESEGLLRSALSHFDDTAERAEAARTQLEIARTRLAAHGPGPLVSQEFQQALLRAESCRRSVLVRRVEVELEAVDREAFCTHAYRRVRGRGIDEDASSLTTGSTAIATILFLDLQGFTRYSQGMDPETVMMTLNQMMADLEAILERHQAKVTAYLGDGFMAMVREARHAERAVEAALDMMAVLSSFNRPRSVLGLPLLPARVGINTGGVFLGNVGTYHKLDYTAIGAAVNLAARLQAEGRPGLPCVSRATWDLLQDRFAAESDRPRSVDLKGIGACEVWDIIGRKDRLAARASPRGAPPPSP